MWIKEKKLYKQQTKPNESSNKYILENQRKG